MKRYLIMLLILCLLAPSVMALQGGHMIVSMVNQIPDPVEPGDYVDVRLKLENIGDERLENIEMEFLPSYPFSLDPGDDAVKEIRSLDAYQKEGRAVIVKYKLRVDDSAVEGTNNFQVRVREGDKPWVTRQFEVDVASQQANMELVSVNATPSPAYPGREISLSFEAKNLAESSVRNVRFKLDLARELAGEGQSLPFAPLTHGTEKEASVVRGGETFSFEYDIMVDPSARSGIYKIPVLITYYDQKNREFVKNEMFGVIVNSEPRLSIILDEREGVRAGKTNDISIRFTNKGLPDLKFLTATIQETEQFEVFSPKESYMGNLDSDFYDVANYKIYVEPTNESFVTIPITYEYMDAVNNKYSFSEELQVRVLTPELEQKMGISHETGGSIIFYMVIGAVILFIVYRYYRKRKQR